MFKTDMTITVTIFVFCLILMWIKVMSILFGIFIMISWMTMILVQFKDFYAQSIGQL